MEILTEAQRQEYEVKASEIAKQLGVSKVHPIVFVKPNSEPFEYVVAYLKEPNFQTKIYAKDKAYTHGMYVCANELLEQLIIKESSDAITYSSAPESDEYKLGICDYIISNLVTSFVNVYKKK